MNASSAKLSHRPITRQAIEARVLDGLKERLLAPDLVAAFVKAFREESGSEALRAEQAQRERKAAELDRKIAAIFRAIEDGFYEPAMKTRLAELKEERDKLKTESRAFDPTALDVLMHPQLAEGYRAPNRSVGAAPRGIRTGRGARGRALNDRPRGPEAEAERTRPRCDPVWRFGDAAFGVGRGVGQQKTLRGGADGGSTVGGCGGIYHWCVSTRFMTLHFAGLSIVLIDLFSHLVS
jgi:hypothetical protein